MTAPQHRILRQPYQPSQSQPIPQRYGNSQQQFNNQSFSPRHPAQPSSSPLHHQPYFPQPTTHDMFKGPGVAGTPPSMMGMPPQYFVNGGQRHRVPNPSMQARNQIYGHFGPQHPMRYPNVNPQPQYYPSPTAVPPFPMMQSNTATMPQQPTQMYQQHPYQQQYQQPPPPGPPISAQMPPVSHPSQMMQQPPQSAGRREKKRIKIVDPNTNQDITDDILKSKDSTSTPPSGRSSVTGTPPTSVGDVAAKFAAQVAMAAGVKNPAGVADPSMMPMNVNSQQFVPQQQQDQIVGSPNMPGMNFTPPFMNATQQRPRMAHPPQYPAEPVNHQGNVGVFPSNQMQQIVIPQPPPQQAYQLPNQPQQSMATDTHLMPQNIPDNVYTLPVASQPKLTPGQVRIARPPQASQKEDVPETKQEPSERIEHPVEIEKTQPVSDEQTTPTATLVAASEEPQNGAIVPSAQDEQPTEQTTPVANVEPDVNKEVPSQPEDLKQAAETEDTAIRLENADVEYAVDQADGNDKVELPDKLEQCDTTDTKSADVTDSPRADDATQSITESDDKDKVAPIPSGKPLISEPPPPEPETIPQTEKQPVVDTVPAEPLVTDHTAPGQVDAGSSEQEKQPSQSSVQSQKSPEHVAVNGISSDASVESDVSQKPKFDTPSLEKVIEQEVDDKTRDPSQSNDKPVADKSSDKSDGDSAKGKSSANIKYKDDDQWSPANQQGKKQYDSNFLLQFQYRPTSMEKPKGLPNIDCVLEQPHKKSSGPMEIGRGGGSDFIPHYMTRGPRDKRMGRQNSKEYPPRRHGRPSGPMIIPKKVVSIDKDVELKTTANAWKPLKRAADSEKSTDEIETMAVERDVRVILNKITPSTFKELMQQVLTLKIDTEKKLRKTIDIIFEKAIDEPSFSEAYANMCRQMTQIRVTVEPNPEQPNPAGQVEFRKLLLTKCQREFERDRSDREHLLELKKKMEENTDPVQAPQLKEEYETAEFKDRRRTLGNIRFIGELFKLRMLTEPIMHSCIMTLFKAKDDDHLESLCRLLTTIGKDLDHPKAKQRLDQYFDQIKKIIAEKRTSSRVRFMLQDVNDLRANNWVPRAVQSQGPKTISQIRQDAKNEQEMLQLKLATTPTPQTKLVNNRGPNRMGNRTGHEDGWTKVQTPKPTRFDPSKMKLMKANTDETKVTLGPSRGFGGWKSGSAGSSMTKTGSTGYSPSSSMDRTPEGGARSNTPTNMMNRFSALDHEYQRRPGGRQNSRDGGSRSGSRGSMGPPSTNSGGRTPRRDERSSLLEATRKITSADRSQESRRQRSRETSPSVPKPRPATPQQTVPAHQYNTALDEDKMRQKSKSIFEEFLSIVDFKEATECIEELNAPPSLMNCFVYVAHEFTLEKKRIERVNTGRLMAHLLKRGRLSVEQYVKGLAELLEMATDYEIDVPKVWEYFAEQLSPVFHAENDAEISINVLGTLAAPLQEEDRSGVFVAEIVKEIVKQAGIESFSSRWQKCNLRWSKIVGKDGQDVVNFLEKYGLEALVDCEGGPEQNQDAASTAWQSKLNNQYRLERDITELLDRRLQNDEIFDWVEKTLSPEAATGPDFIRALTIAVSKRSLSRDAKDADKMTLDEDKITERSILLNKYIENRPARELQVLYALQSLMVELEQPRDVLRKFFDIFYNEDVVQEQTFYKWEKSDDPNEQEGRGVAVASVNMFFTWLRTAEPESD